MLENPTEYCTTVVFVSNNNIYINIKLYFCSVHRSILKYRVIDVFGETFQTFSQVLVVSRNVNKYGISALVVSES